MVIDVDITERMRDNRMYEGTLILRYNRQQGHVSVVEINGVDQYAETNAYTVSFIAGAIGCDDNKRDIMQAIHENIMRIGKALRFQNAYGITGDEMAELIVQNIPRN